MTNPDPTAEVLADLSVQHRWLHSYDVVPERFARWQVGDWHCVCGWFGNHGWEGFASHLSEVIRLAARGYVLQPVTDPTVHFTQAYQITLIAMGQVDEPMKEYSSPTGEMGTSPVRVHISFPNEGAAVHE